jgi:nucleoid-associated protein YgaU
LRACISGDLRDHSPLSNLKSGILAQTRPTTTHYVQESRIAVQSDDPGCLTKDYLDAKKEDIMAVAKKKSTKKPAKKATKLAKKKTVKRVVKKVVKKAVKRAAPKKAAKKVVKKAIKKAAPKKAVKKAVKKAPVKKAAPASSPKPAPAMPPKPLSPVPAMTAPAPKIKAWHVVTSADTPTSITQKYYGSSDHAKWMAIYDINKAVIGADPNQIRPGLLLRIPEA